MTTKIRGKLSGYGYIPPGGTTGDYLVKSSDADGDTEWSPGNEVDIRQFGADGVDDTEAIYESGITLKRVRIPSGTWYASSISWTTDVELTLEEGAVLKRLDGTGETLITSTANLTIIGGTIDGNKDTTSERVETVVCTGDNFICERVRFQNTITSAIRIDDCAGLVIVRDCQFSGMAEHNGLLGGHTQCIDIESTAAQQVLITGNRFIGETPSSTGRACGGVIVSGSAISCRFSDNYFSKIGQNEPIQDNLIGNIDLYNDAEQTIITGNVIEGAFFQPIKMQNASNVICSNNLINGANSTSSEGMINFQNARSFPESLQHCVISNNIVDITGDIDHRCLTIDGQAGGAYDSENISVTGNIFRGGEYGVTLKQIDYVSLSNNIFEGQSVHGVWGEELGDDGPHINISGGMLSNIGGMPFFFPVSKNTNNLNINISNVVFDGTLGTPTSFCQIRGESGAMLERVAITGCVIKGSCSGADIDIQWADKVLITGNMSDGNSANVSLGNNTIQKVTGNSWQALQTYTTGAHSTLRDFTGTTTAAHALSLVETLVDDLKTQGLAL